jgi:aspartate/methionine/tyrosine aminotransferase
MEIEREPLGDWFIYGREIQRTVGWKYVLAQVARSSCKISEVLDDPLKLIEHFDTKSLDWSGHFDGLPIIRERLIENLELTALSGIEGVMLTNGTYEANTLPTLISVKNGDEVVIERPAWKQVDVISKAIGAKIKYLDIQEEDGYRPNIDDLNTLVTKDTKLVFINHPNNPTGSILEESDMKAICEICDDAGARLVSDEIYRGLEWNDKMSPAACNFSETAISTGSLTKITGLPGIRIGWMASQDTDYMRGKVFPLHRYAVMSCNVLGEYIAAEALEPTKFHKLVGDGKKIGRENLEHIDNFMKNSDVWNWVKPGGGYISFPGYDRSKLDMTSEELCKVLINKPYQVYLVPGSAYGDAHEGHVRVGFGGSTEIITGAFEVIEQFTEDNRK